MQRFVTNGYKSRGSLSDNNFHLNRDLGQKMARQENGIMLYHKAKYLQTKTTTWKFNWLYLHLIWSLFLLVKCIVAYIDAFALTLAIKRGDRL